MMRSPWIIPAEWEMRDGLLFVFVYSRKWICVSISEAGHNIQVCMYKYNFLKMQSINFLVFFPVNILEWMCPQCHKMSTDKGIFCVLCQMHDSSFPEPCSGSAQLLMVLERRRLKRYRSKQKGEQVSMRPTAPVLQLWHRINLSSSVFIIHYI